MYINIFKFWNESSEFPLFLMGKFALINECFGLQARLQNELCSQTKVPLYISGLFCVLSTLIIWTLLLYAHSLALATFSPIYYFN
jgi:hypothetical protein